MSKLQGGDLSPLFLMTIATGTKLGHYEIRSQLGAGGMGEVYLAEDTQLGRRVAIKLLPPETVSDEHARKRLVREARAAATLDHPNICSIYEVGEADGRSFIAMQYVEGETLDLKLKRKPLELKESLTIAAQVADALSEAHRHGIIHRDIKPSNIMITSRGQAKVMDFGLAKLIQHSDVVQSEAETEALLSTPGAIIGTIPYMSPEQVRGEVLDGSSDIFSFGVVLYEMFSGLQPFASESSAATASAILTREPPRLARFMREAPAELERIVMKALAKHRDERYQTAKDLLIDLKGLKQKLVVEAEIERSAPLEEFGVPPSGGPVSDAKSSPPEGGTPNTRASSAEYIATGIKRHKIAGFISLIVIAAGIAGLSAYLRARSSEVAIESIAVLPFVNQNNDPNTEYLSDGIPESIINSLSQLPNLKVMSRNSVFHYKGKDMDAQTVAKELKVQAVLTGRVAQRGDGLSISVELINAQDNSQIWGQQYNRKLADVFAVQEEIAKEISEKLRLKLTNTERQQLAKRPTENLKAFQYYMQGRAYAQRRTREDLLTAIQYDEKALGEDPNYALAYAGLADAYSNLGSRAFISPVEGQRKAEEAARKALALDENLAEAHLALGQPHTLFPPYNYSVSERELQRAIELSPSLATPHQYLGLSLSHRGRFDEALTEFQKARELDPLSPSIARTGALPYYLKRDYVRALELLRQADKLGPAFSQPWEIGVYIQNKLYNETLGELEQAKRERKDDSILIYFTGMVYAAQEKRVEALQIIKELEVMSGATLDQAHYIAKIYATLNERDQALTWLERGLAAGAIGSFYKDDPVWDPIRSDPRYADLLRRMGIPS